MANKKVNQLTMLFEKQQQKEETSTNEFSLKRTKSLAVDLKKTEKAQPFLKHRYESFSQRREVDITKTKNVVFDDLSTSTSSKKSFQEKRALLEALQKQNVILSRQKSNNFEDMEGSATNTIDYKQQISPQSGFSLRENIEQTSTWNNSNNTYENTVISVESPALQATHRTCNRSYSSKKDIGRENKTSFEKPFNWDFNDEECQVSYENTSILKDQKSVVSNRKLPEDKLQDDNSPEIYDYVQFVIGTKLVNSNAKPDNNSIKSPIVTQKLNVFNYTSENWKGSVSSTNSSNEEERLNIYDDVFEGDDVKLSTMKSNSKFLNDLQSKLIQSFTLNTAPSTEYYSAVSDTPSYDEVIEQGTSFQSPEVASEPYENTKVFSNVDLQTKTERSYRISEISDWSSDEEPEVNVDHVPSSPQKTACKDMSLKKLIKEILLRKEGHKISWKSVVQCSLFTHLDKFSPQEIHLYEAKFRLAVSEIEHLNNINILNHHFASKLSILLSKNDFETLFGLIPEMQKCAATLVTKIEECWKINICLNGLCDIIYQYVTKHLDIYLQYYGLQVFISDVYSNLLRNRTNFTDILNTIEADPDCYGIKLQTSFLEPLQKINSFPKFLDDILQYLPRDHPEYESCQKAKVFLQEFITKCAEQEGKCEEMFLKSKLEKIIGFPKSMQVLAITKEMRRNIVRIGKAELIEIDNSIFGRGKLVKKPVHLFLFNDVLIITKKSCELKYTVLQYCFRINISLLRDVALPVVYKHINSNILFVLEIMENNENKAVELLVCCKSPGDKQAWCEALDPPDRGEARTLRNKFENFQVIVTQAFKAKQQEQLSLQLRDILQVYIDTDDGWFFGKRLKDATTGWFPSECVMQTVKTVNNTRQLH